MMKKTVRVIMGVAFLMVSVALSASAQAEDDVILFRDGSWSGNISSNGFGPLPSETSLGGFGFAWANPMVGDVNGDGLDDMVVAQDPENDGVGEWGWAAAYTVDADNDGTGEMSSTLGTPPTSGFAWGDIADTRYTGLADITGDGIQDAVYVTSGFVWFATPSSTSGLGTGTTQGNIGYGTTTLNDHPILGDFNGDGMDDFGVWRQDTGGTFIKLTGGIVGSGVMGAGGTATGVFGNTDWDYALVGDLNGDGRDDLVLVEKDTAANLMWQVAFGQADGRLDVSDQGNLVHFGDAETDVPMLADINGDGRDDLIAVRTDTGSDDLSYHAAFTGAGGVLTAAVDSSLDWGSSALNDFPLFGQLNVELIPSPDIGNITVNQLPGTNGLAVTWTTEAGSAYAIQSKTNLLDESWTNDITGIVGTGGDVTVTTAVDHAQSFYRVIMNDFIHQPDSKHYLVFELTNVPLWDFDRAIGELVVDLGTNNPASDRMYAFGMNGMPLLTRSVAVLNGYVDSVFDVAEAHGVPAYFHIDPVYGIGTDNIPAGEGPALQYWDHPAMCEWVNFPTGGQTAGQVPRSWVNWGSWVKLGSALPNYESPALQQFYISQLEDGILKPIKERLLTLQKEGKGYLFAGLNIGWETRFSDKSGWAGVAITNAFNPSEVMYEWEKAKTGYAALHTKGWDDASLTIEASARGISKDRLFYDLCAESVQTNMILLAKTARDYGFYKSQVFSHIVALESYYSDWQINNNVETPPVWTALNDYSTPGFTLDEHGAAVYDLNEMQSVFAAHGHEFKYGAVETYMVHYQTEAAYRAQLDEYFNNGTTLIAVFGAVDRLGVSPSAYTMNDDQAAAIRDWMN